MAERLVLHHTYTRGRAFDVSEHGNHGVLRGGVEPSPTEVGAMAFDGGPTWIQVPSGPSFTDMRSFRIVMRFQVNPPSAGDPGRQNLIEGHLSFALFVNPDFTLQATLLDRNGAWTGPTSPAGIRIVQPAQWHVVEYRFDGVGTSRIVFNGTLVGERHDVPGPVRDVGPQGVAIGHWPHPDDRYSLDGLVDDVRMWVYDPDPDVRDLLDDCCIERDGLDAILREAAAAGFRADDWTDLARDVQDLGAEIAYATRGSDPARIAELSRLTRHGMLAVTTGDTAGLAGVFGDLVGTMRAAMPDADVVAFGERALEQVLRSPLGPSLFGTGDGDDTIRLDLDAARRLAALLCLGELVPDDRPSRPGRPGPLPPPKDRDPATDHAAGEPPPGWGENQNPTPPDEPGLPEPPPGVPSTEVGP